MRLMVTGSPGVGKTTISKIIAKKFNLQYINEKDFALKNSIGYFNEENELELPILEFERKANLFLSKNDDVLFEGHVICEMDLNVDLVILLRVNPEDLELRLENRNYSKEKIMDNVFCEGIDYCLKKLLNNYPHNQIFELSSQTSQNLTVLKIFEKILNLNKS
jgi:adenylate kinase